MSKEQLKQWLDKQKLGLAILICPRCGKVDINPKTHLDQCDPAGQQMRQEAQDYYD